MAAGELVRDQSLGPNGLCPSLPRRLLDFTFVVAPPLSLPHPSQQDLSDNYFDAVGEEQLACLTCLPNLQARTFGATQLAGVEETAAGSACRGDSGWTAVGGMVLVSAARMLLPALCCITSRASPCARPAPQRLKLRCCQLPSVPPQLCNLTRLTHLVGCWGSLVVPVSCCWCGLVAQTGHRRRKGGLPCQLRCNSS